MIRCNLCAHMAVMKDDQMSGQNIDGSEFPIGFSVSQMRPRYDKSSVTIQFRQKCAESLHLSDI